MLIYCNCCKNICVVIFNVYFIKKKCNKNIKLTFEDKYKSLISNLPLFKICLCFRLYLVFGYIMLISCFPICPIQRKKLKMQTIFFLHHRLIDLLKRISERCGLTRCMYTAQREQLLISGIITKFALTTVEPLVSEPLLTETHF